MKATTDAGKWLAAQGLQWDRPKHAPTGNKAKLADSRSKRRLRSKNTNGGNTTKSISDFVKANRNHNGHDCLFVPGAQKDVPASLSWLGKQITAARYMCLLTQGTPPENGMLVRHLCGNGHLSCVNPGHLAWGTASDNASDAAKHRKAGDNVQDRINNT